MQPAADEERTCTLIVDDDEIARCAMAGLLTELGYAVLAAEDAESALEIFATNPVDLVITDLGLPEISGWQLAVEIKKLRSDMPVIVFSGSVIPGIQEKAREMGVDHILTKPCPLPVLMDTLQKALQTPPSS